MRDRAGWRRQLEAELSTSPPMLFEIELALFLMERVVPGCPAIGGWTLLGGYPFAASAGRTLSPDHEVMLARARVYLGRLRRRHVWRQELDRYQRLPEADRGYDVADPSSPATRRAVTRGAGRWDAYAAALDEPPGFERRSLPLADAGDHWFLSRQRHRLSANIPAELVLARPAGHDLDAPLVGGGKPLTAAWEEVLDTARWMDSTLTAARQSSRRPSKTWRSAGRRSPATRVPGPG